MDPVIGYLESAYALYDLPNGRIATDETLTRDEMMPKYTKYTATRKETVDHIFYNSDMFEVT